MAYTFDLNVEVENNTEALLAWKDSAVLNGGMVVVQSGDGLLLGPTGLGDENGDVLTVADFASITAGNIGNPEAWWRGQWPNGREIMWRRGDASGFQNCLVVYSAAAGFVDDKYGSTAGGAGADLTVGPQTPPSASDGAHIHGGIDLMGWGVTMFDQTATGGVPGEDVGRCVLNMCWGGEAEDYSWYVFDWEHGEGAEGPGGGMFLDALTNVPSARVDGVVIGVLRSGANWFDFQSEVCDGRVGQRMPDNSVNAPGAWKNAMRTAAGDGGVAAGPPDPVDNNSQQMWNAFIMQLGHALDPAANFQHTSTGEPIPSNGVLVGNDPVSGKHSTFGPAQWFIRYQVSQDSGTSGYLGASRLFRYSNRAHGSRDMSDDLNWRFLGMVGIRWDGVTGKVII